MLRLCEVEGGQSNIILDIEESRGTRMDQPTNPAELPISGDPLSEIILDLVFPKGNPYFTLNGKMLQLLSPLDRDKDNLSHIVFQLTCTVKSTNKKRTIPVIVRVVDVNDNAPVFVSTPYNTTISEGDVHRSVLGCEVAGQPVSTSRTVGVMELKAASLYSTCRLVTLLYRIINLLYTRRNSRLRNLGELVAPKAAPSRMNHGPVWVDQPPPASRSLLTAHRWRLATGPTYYFRLVRYVLRILVYDLCCPNENQNVGVNISRLLCGDVNEASLLVDVIVCRQVTVVITRLMLADLESHTLLQMTVYITLVTDNEVISASFLEQHSVTSSRRNNGFIRELGQAQARRWQREQDSCCGGNGNCRLVTRVAVLAVLTLLKVRNPPGRPWPGCGSISGIDTPQVSATSWEALIRTDSGDTCRTASLTPECGQVTRVVGGAAKQGDKDVTSVPFTRPGLDLKLVVTLPNLRVPDLPAATVLLTRMVVLSLQN
ncbi:hypothetical protein J6590_063018 [Homalodisca vitripennis]|nr:hypothetical protein J6590_063018 [Homalodisca vitripennis]